MSSYSEGKHFPLLMSASVILQFAKKKIRQKQLRVKTLFQSHKQKGRNHLLLADLGMTGSCGNRFTCFMWNFEPTDKALFFFFGSCIILTLPFSCVRKIHSAEGKF